MEIVHNLESKYEQGWKETENDAGRLCEVPARSGLSAPKYQSHLVRWVREFLLFAEEHGGYTFEQTLDLFLAAIGKPVGIKPWQIQQAPSNHLLDAR